MQPDSQAGGQLWHVCLLQAGSRGILCKRCTFALQVADCIGTDFKLNKAARVVAWLETLAAQSLANMQQGDCQVQSIGRGTLLTASAKVMPVHLHVYCLCNNGGLMRMVQPQCTT